MKTLIFDIETIGENFDDIDPLTQENLTRWVKKTAHGDDVTAQIDDIKNGLGFSPLTGQIVTLGFMDLETKKRGVYFSAPNSEMKDFVEDDVQYRVMNEAQMLRSFWEIAINYNVFVSFNGYAFDAPFMNMRSAVNKVRPTVNLMVNRYLGYQKSSPAQHVDLADQLSYYGAVRRKGSLHLYCRALGIETPKSEEISGDQVTFHYNKGNYVEIAKYNARDLVATSKLFEVWKNYLSF